MLHLERARSRDAELAGVACASVKISIMHGQGTLHRSITVPNCDSRVQALLQTCSTLLNPSSS